MSRSIEWLPSLFFFLSFFLSFADSCISHDGKTDKRARSLGADTQVHQKVRVKWWLVHPWLAGWLAPEALVGKLQRSLPRFISRLRASISMPRSIFSPALHPLSSSTRRRFTRSLARSLSLFSRGSHFSFKPHTMRQMNRICETRGSGFGG